MRGVAETEFGWFDPIPAQSRFGIGRGTAGSLVAGPMGLFVCHRELLFKTVEFAAEPQAWASLDPSTFDVFLQTNPTLPCGES